MEQVERTRRYLKRIREIYKQVPYTQDSREYYVDDVYSFFIHCHHIRDWIIHLNTVGLVPQQLDNFINAHYELRICADLCNGTKHCEMRKEKLRTSRQPHVAVRTFTSDGVYDGVTEKMTHTQGKFYILSGDKFYDALELAESCMKLWDDFIGELVRTAAMQERRA